jgi:hypothetical protein
MDPQARNLALLEFQEFNKSMRTRGQCHMHEPLEFHLALPQLPIKACVRTLLSTCVRIAAWRSIGAAHPLRNLVAESASSSDVLTPVVPPPSR